MYMDNDENTNYHMITRSKAKRIHNKDLKKGFKRLKVNCNNKIIRDKIKKTTLINSTDSESDCSESEDDEYINKKVHFKKNSVKDYEPIITEESDNDITFLNKLKKNEIKYIASENKRIKDLLNTNIPPKYKILLSKDLDINVKSIALQKLNTLSNISNDSTEYYKIHEWFKGLIDIPFGKYKDMPIKKRDGKEKVAKFLFNVQQELNKTVYGMEYPKSEILQYITQCITNPNTSGNILAIEGPPGTGKTSLIKDGVCSALKRPFGFIALGGATDSAFLEGHGYTYEGATHGKIISILKKSKCMNPVIFFDELDKVSQTKKGEEIIGILMHLIDSTQNTCFHDKYYSDIDFDLSKVLFIFSFNDSKKIDPILRDRMKIIKIGGYSSKQKLIIAKDYLLPKIYKNIGLPEKNIIWEKDALNKVISMTENIQGVREVKRHLTTIIQKINTLQFANIKHFKIELPYEVKKIRFPLTITLDIVNKLCKPSVNINGPPPFMYM